MAKKPTQKENEQQKQIEPVLLYLGKTYKINNEEEMDVLKSEHPTIYEKVFERFLKDKKTETEVENEQSGAK